MQTNKRVRNMWIVVGLLNLGIIILLAYFMTDGFSSLKYIRIKSLAAAMEIIVPILGFAVLSTLPVLLSKSNHMVARLVGHGVPLLLTIPAWYGLYYVYNCEGKFCEMSGVGYLYLFGVTALLISVFYTIGRFGYKKPEDYVKWYLWFEPILVAGPLIVWILLNGHP